MKKILLIAFLTLIGSQASHAFTWYGNGAGWKYTFMGWVNFGEDNWAYSDDMDVWFNWQIDGGGITYYADFGTIFFTSSSGFYTTAYRDEGWYYTDENAYPITYIFKIVTVTNGSFGPLVGSEIVNAWSSISNDPPRAAYSYYTDPNG